MNKIIRRLLREPLLHFFALGALIFVFYANGNVRDESSPDVIVISAMQVEQLASQFASVWKRPPTGDELDTVIEGYIREEVYYREALVLGLDRNDTVVRQRLRQKMEFLTDNGAQLLEPTASELQEYRAANEKRYQQGARRALEQVFLGQTPAPDHVAGILAQLHADPDLDPWTLGENSMLPAELDLSLPEAIDSVYGRGFFDQIRDYAVGPWSGPVVSGYGVHLVRILDQEDIQALPLEEVRAAVVRDWQAEKAIELRERDFAARRAHFEIRIEGPGDMTQAADR